MSISLEKLAIYRPATAFLDDVNGGPPTLNVLAFLPDGLGQLTYDPIFHGWTGWRTHPVAIDSPYEDVVASNDLDFYLFALGWYDGTLLPTSFRVGPRMNGFVGYFNSSGQSDLGTPWWIPVQPLQPQWDYTWDNWPPPSSTQGEGFFPTGGFHWFDGQNYRLNIFGASFQEQGPPQKTLREFYWDQGWNWTEHGLPASWTANFRMGPNNVVWDPDRTRGYVFGAAEAPAPPSHQPELFVRFYDPDSSWSWLSLGNPYPQSGSVRSGGTMSPPLAVSRVENGLFKINVMVLADKVDSSQGTQLWELWERFYDGSQWQPWNNHGPLPGVTPVVPPDPNFEIEPDFTLSSGVVWYDDTGSLRINLFGTNRDDSRLVEFRWDGGWLYGFNVPAPNNMRIRTAASAVLGQYITVVGRTEDGQIWEFFWDPTSPRFNGDWAWRGLFP